MPENSGNTTEDDKGDSHNGVSPEAVSQEILSRDGEIIDRGEDNRLTIVGIGASAGGLAALKTLLARLPSDSGMAFVVVVHLSPEQKSHLAELLQPKCHMPVLQVSETIEIKPDHVYVIPPNANLSTIDTHLRLTSLEERRLERAQIDHFLCTLAKTHDGHAIGVILTGTGSDGTLGLRWIKEQGGVTIAQLPEEAQFDGMPRSAIASGFVDLVLPLDEMPENLLRIARTQPRLRERGEGGAGEADGDRIIVKILGQVRAHVGHDFSMYKQATVRRRIARRMQLHQIETLPEYLNYLREHREESSRLFDDLLITVTEFFRDESVFEHLEEHAIPAVFKDKGHDDRVRIWSVGCSTGEEAYSIAMLVLEEAARRGVERPQIQIFASDLHERSLKTAREGLYPESLTSSVSPERLRRWFFKEDGHYRVRPELREVVVFAPHDLLRDPPFSHQDMVVCRNVMIYLQRDLQDDALQLFHYALRPDGLLVLGGAESISETDGFAAENKKLCIFRKRDLPFRAGRLPLRPPLTAHRHPDEPAPEARATRPRAGYGDLHARMAEQYAPPSVLVNRAFEVVHFSLHAGRFLELRGGEPTMNIFKLAPEPLRVELRAALCAAREQGKGIRTKPVTLTLDGEQRQVVVRVRLADEPSLEGFALIIFDELFDAPKTESVESDANSTSEELEAELQLTKQRMQSVIEEYETSQEEMQATNEEFQSANEELRSTMEELETSKEELQSMNEELTTVNQENQHRVAELSQLTSDLSNLLAATQIATLFLDRDLRIVRFTPQVGELFNIRATDRGRPLSDLTHNLADAPLVEDARQVLDRLTPVERETRAQNDRWYFSRVMPYRNADDRIDGVVITLIDVSDLKGAQSARDISEFRYRSLFNSIDQGFCVIEMIYDEDGRACDYRFLETNPAFETHTGLRDAAGRTIRELVPQLEDHWFTTFARVVESGESERFRKRAEALDRDFDIFAFRVGPRERRRAAILFSDITDSMRAEQALLESHDQLEQRVRGRTAELEAKNKRLSELSRQLASAEHRERKRLAAMLHDELQQYLVAIKTQLSVARDEQEREKATERVGMCLGLIDEAITCSRDLTYRLRPPVLDEAGFEPVLEWLAESTAQWYGISVSIETDNSQPELSPETQDVLFNAVRELLLNVAKHAETDEACVRVGSNGDRLSVVVFDEGCGSDLDYTSDHPRSGEHYGLTSIRESVEALGGHVNIRTAPGKGMRVELELPLNGQQPD